MKNVFSLSCLLVNIILFAQVSSGKIVYKNLVSKQEKATLFFDRNSSLFLLQNDKNEETKIIKMSDGSIVYPSNTIDSIANRTKFIYFDNKKKTFYNNVINNDIEVVLFDISKVKWKITDEKKEILMYSCQKAEGEYYGKRYTAWFTRELPYNYGPLKINGLNGIILEVSTNENSFHLIAENLINSDFSNEIQSFTSKYDFNKSISREDYKKILDSQLKEFEDNININLPETKKIKLKKDCLDCNEK